MLQEFSQLYETRYRKEFPWQSHKINCLAHVINLRTQTLISTYSKAPHYSPHDPHAHEPDTSQNDRDEVGLIRSICIKERSSAKRKELYKAIQTKAGVSSPTQLLLDMKQQEGVFFSLFHPKFLFLVAHHSTSTHLSIVTTWMVSVGDAQTERVSSTVEDVLGLAQG
ncbi:uncharacterized protein EDB93DRAFT_1248829 [Suillus bovinus]|uniref:uncharacterized protein n=1 Tax=Suillus bovinus TaxID=48563 RepID=UPI001B876499|nr:uncharacterized protein EDB93DRAFT_1248829 [Suillus bovinus]KAG2153565.1 hypothetical protein EDB93DRAFT_1248829 [Suillus bovinus]